MSYYNLSRLKCSTPAVLASIIEGKELKGCPAIHSLLQKAENFTDAVFETEAPDEAYNMDFHLEAVKLSIAFPDETIYGIYSRQSDLFKKAYVLQYKNGQSHIIRELFNADGMFIQSCDIRPEDFRNLLN